MTSAFRVVGLAFVALALIAAPGRAQFEQVGSLDFPTSATGATQQHFLRGVAILHSFGWKQAIAEFQLAQKAQPDFALGNPLQPVPHVLFPSDRHHVAANATQDPLSNHEDPVDATPNHERPRGAMP